MEGIKEYLITIIAAALISTIAMRLTEKCGSCSNIIRLILAVFLSISVVSPILKIEIHDFTGFINANEMDAQAIISNAESTAREEAAAVIIERTEAYIEEKAALYGAEITATITISDTSALLPDSVIICGNISPYGKISLEKIIKDDLGIPEDRQTWN